MWKRPSRHKSLADATRGRDNVEIHRQVRRILNDIPDYSKDGTWGFVVYRTVYTPESNTLFPRVLEILNDYLRSKVFKEVDEFIEKWDLERWGLGPDPTVNEELMKCHKMIVHDDQAKFDGLSLDDVRTHFEEWVTGLPPPRTRKDDEDSEGMRDVWPRYRTCLVIDDEILNILSDVPLEAEYAKTCEWNPRAPQTPQQRRANERYAKHEASKRGKLEPLAKPKQKSKPAISVGWVVLLAFVVCGGVLFELARVVPEIWGLISSFLNRWSK
ncbi:hypothetical protein FQN57_004564 [Myotisia sp. PD_48]|nr:hypothetical protein FQN57_004564 [Myotisia sp. PD_48]